MKYDLIIVSQSKGDLIQTTQNCINTALADGADVNVILVETGGEIVQYKNVNQYVLYKGTFCYNRALNEGLQHAKGDVHILANNDLIFHPGWSRIGDLMALNGYHSASAINGIQNRFPAGNYVYDGYTISQILTGWCIFMDRYCHEKIGKLDESVVFWYSDDLYALQLQSVGIMHGLFCNIRVDHIASRTLKKQPARIQRLYEIGEGFKFKIRQRFYADLTRRKSLKVQ
jgi:GT2 family glycosyltransferase